MKFIPQYYSEKLDKKTINPFGNVGILTLWSKEDYIKQKIKKIDPSLLAKDSPIAALTNFYGNGLPQLLSNLAYNPQINKIAILGKDSNVVPSSEYLLNFLKEGVELENFGGTILGRIKNTQYYLDPQLTKEQFSYLEVKKFTDASDPNFIKFLKNNSNINKKSRLEIKLIEPAFEKFPSDITSHSISAQTPIEAWEGMMYKLNRFGEDTYIKKGNTQEKRRTLIDFNARISNPSKNDFGKLIKYGFNMDELESYGNQILETIIPEGVEYTYGNRLRGYWEGEDTLEKMVELLKENKNTRFAFTTLWDPKEDLLKRKSSPCFTDIQLITKPNTNQLMALASFRTHNAPSAWLPNLYGIKAIQEYVSKRVGLIPGQINIKSRYLSLDPNSSKTISSLNLLKENRKKAVNIHDPKGNYSVDIDRENQKIILNHYAPNGTFLEKIVGDNAEEIKNNLRNRDAFSSADHAMWIGMELIKAQNKLDNENE